MRCAVLGDPVAHSLSPVLHRAAYAACGLDDWTYEAVRVPGGGLAAFVDGRDASWRGLSVTAPLKREAAERADEVSPTVALAGGANTLVHDGERWLAENTDVPGAAAALRERWAGVPVVATILGGGATAASVGLALTDLGCQRLRLLVRDPDRAAASVAAVRRHPSRPDVSLAALDDAEVTGDVLVSTLPAAAQSPGLVARCADVPVVFEVVYHPWPTPLAASVGTERTLVTGLDLLVHQAALQVELFTGGAERADVVAAMRAVLP